MNKPDEKVLYELRRLSPANLEWLVGSYGEEMSKMQSEKDEVCLRWIQGGAQMLDEMIHYIENVEQYLESIEANKARLQASKNAFN